MSKPTSLFLILFALLASFVAGLPLDLSTRDVTAGLPGKLDLSTRDVFVPKILYPNADTVWKAGNHHNVTWDTTNAPVNITNGKGMIVFAKNNLMFTNQTGGLDDPLASGFDILLGRFEIQVPEVAPGEDYQIVLFGDSGNISPKFTITN